jgi:hypothetical protein
MPRPCSFDSELLGPPYIRIRSDAIDRIGLHWFTTNTICIDGNKLSENGATCSKSLLQALQHASHVTSGTLRTSRPFGMTSFQRWFGRRSISPKSISLHTNNLSTFDFSLLPGTVDGSNPPLDVALFRAECTVRRSMPISEKSAYSDTSTFSEVERNGIFDSTTASSSAVRFRSQEPSLLVSRRNCSISR